MMASGSSAFTDADGYQASLHDMLDLLVFRPREFSARLTWLDLSLLHLLRSYESSARVAYVTLPGRSIFITFPVERGAPLIYDGVELRVGEIMLHGPGDEFHQRTIGACRWGAVWIAPASLSAWDRAVTGQSVTLPAGRRVLRPSSSDLRRLLRLHTEATRLAERAPIRIGHKELVRALDQDLLFELLKCLTTGEARPEAQDERQAYGSLTQFERLLSTPPHRVHRIREICDTLGVSDHIFKTQCRKILGMSGNQYQRLRCLKRVRAELLRPQAAANVTGTVARYGFVDLHRFVAEYWEVYGEMPPVPAHPRD